MTIQRSQLEFVTEARRPRHTSWQRRIERCVVHVTGRQTWKNAERNKQDPLDRLEAYFNRVGAPACSTYSVCPWGFVRCHMDERHIPWAQGWGRSAQKMRKRRPPRWWTEAWFDVDANMGLIEQEYPTLVTRNHPIELLPDGIESRRGPNWYSVSIEFVQWGNQLLLTTGQYHVGSQLVADICARNDIEHNRLGCLGHEDVHPWRRGYDKTGGWDPGATNMPQPDFDWETMLTLPLMSEVDHNMAWLDELVTRKLAIEAPPMPKWLAEIRRRRDG